MSLKRITDQKSRTIEEFYLDLAEEQISEPWRKSGRAMFALVEKLNNIFKSETIWCLTSLYRLVLLKENDWKSAWFVIVSCSESEEFHIEYLIPNDLKPWDGARVCGGATSLDQAVNYILIAMRNSHGWVDIDKVNYTIN
jgi:hypothetical protein